MTLDGGRVLLRTMAETPPHESSEPPPARRTETRCCVVGGGPAGMVLGLLLARFGVPVVVLEKHADFLRDFRGDTIHPSTLELLHELDLLESFLMLPHHKVSRLAGQLDDGQVTVADFSHLPTVCKFIALMPQWDFLNFLCEEAKKYPHFELRRNTEGLAAIRNGGRVVGVRARDTQGDCTIQAELVVAADGRASTLREAVGSPLLDRGAPMDVLWMRLSRRGDDPHTPLGRFSAGRILVLIDRGEYWQVAFVISKGSAEHYRQRGIAALRAEIAHLAPILQDSVDELESWADVKLLTVTVNRMERWHREGLLCIGDAAHAMSPLGGVGINLAIQDAVAAANVLVPRFHEGTPTDLDLASIQRRREFPTRATQAAQVLLQERVIDRVLRMDQAELRLPWALKLLQRFPVLTRIPARMIGLGVRPEHIRLELPHSPEQDESG